jgi:ribosomal protein L11 methylase PrmA
MAKHQKTIVPHPPYSPDLAPSDFFLFLKLKTTLKVSLFQTIEQIQENVIRELCAITESAFQESFKQWKKHWEQCLKCCKMSNTVFITKVWPFFEHALYTVYKKDEGILIKIQLTVITTKFDSWFHHPSFRAKIMVCNILLDEVFLRLAK